MAEEAMFELDGVCKRFGETLAVDNLSLRIAAGHTMVLVGPSGCGKSTVLRLITGMLAADAGTIRREGDPLDRLNRIATLRQTGFVPQDGGLMPHLSAAANIALPARCAGRSRSWCESRVEEVAALASLPLELLPRRPHELSGGQRSRVSLARALVLDPPVILLDEPFSALDPLVRSDLQQELRQLFMRLRKTVILVTHDLPEAARMSDRVALIRAGALEQCGTFENLHRSPASPFVSRFFAAQAPWEAV